MKVHELLNYLSTECNYDAPVGILVGDEIKEITRIEDNVFGDDEIITLVAES